MYMFITQTASPKANSGHSLQPTVARSECA